MSARELVGRPLVPFFDEQENVNEALRVDAAAREQLDVDARVWDKELGYFVYPSEDDAAATAPQRHHSMPIPIKKTAANPAAPLTPAEGGAGSFGKLLLTPDMLSRSAPTEASNAMGKIQQLAIPAGDNDSRVATPRSASAKRSSRQKSRSSTPNRSSRNKQRNSVPQPTSDDTSSGGEDRAGTGSDGSSEKSKNNKKSNGSKNESGSAKKTRNKQNQQPQTPQKSKDELSANGKWAWSAFQSSPDPKSLPLPPFAAGAGGSPGEGALPPPLDPPKIEERLDPPPPLYGERPPSVPPDAIGLPLQPTTTSIEHSMTQDLRRMLNIGS